MNKRIEYDLLGRLEIPGQAYWGIHTERARRNFHISGFPVNPVLIHAMTTVKKACCLANYELGYVSKDKADAIIGACDDIFEGKLSDQFPLDALQGGAGTSTNMNLNEVIANRAIELLGGTKGEYSIVHPLEDVNRNQSTNDTYPTAIKLAAIMLLRRLSVSIAELQGAFQTKESEFGSIVKIGRTELQEAVPLTMGAEFSAFAEALSRDRWRTFKCEERLRVVNIGGTAVGTGLAAPRRYIFLVIEKLRELTGLGLSRGENIPAETANADVFVEVSAILKAHAVNLIKIANDLRLMNLLGEIHLPRLQAGSSVMPGKVNPVIPEAAMQVGMKVNANDAMIADAASRGTLQINEFLPLLAQGLLESMDLLINVNALLCGYIRQIEADGVKCREYVDGSTAIITAFLPVIGYSEAEKLLKELSQTRGNIREFLTERLGKDLVDDVLSPSRLTALGYRDNEHNAKRK